MLFNLNELMISCVISLILLYTMHSVVTNTLISISKINEKQDCIKEQMLIASKIKLCAKEYIDHKGILILYDEFLVNDCRFKIDSQTKELFLKTSEQATHQVSNKFISISQKLDGYLLNKLDSEIIFDMQQCKSLKFLFKSE